MSKVIEIGAEERLREELRGAMSQFAAGVVMVTTVVDGRPWGMTVSACCSVSMEPPMLLVSLAENSVSAKAIADTGCFGVSILGSRTLPAAQYGSVRGAQKFLEAHCDELSRSRSATPVVAGAIAHVDCRVAQSLQGGDHVVFLGEVVEVLTADRPDDPLVYHGRRYHRLTEESAVGAAPPYLMWW
jgi:flavin reductase (DIM6/NTAB) family NADH-FMN oxidoreductase RutF